MLDREDMGRAGIEPDIQNVFHLLVIVGIVALPRKRDGGELNQASAPSASKASIDARVDRFVVQNLAGLLVHEDRERHAPGALARQNPIGPVLHHRADAVLARAADTISCRAIACIASCAQACLPSGTRLVDRRQTIAAWRGKSPALWSATCG